jgi:hypothetical protein
MSSTMANTELILGLAGIIGTLLGALSATGVALYVERKKEHREDRVSRGELRRAARLVGTEIQEAIGAVDTALSSGTPWSAEDAPSRAAWLEYSALLATNLRTEEYRSVSRAYVSLKLAVGASGSGGELTSAHKESLELTKGALAEASAALDRLAAT